MAIMATHSRVKEQEKPVDHELEVLILKLIEERPAFLGAPDLEARLIRSQAAENLNKAGFPTTAKTLATKASRGGGPPYCLFGRRPIYKWRDLLVWAHSQMSSPRRSSSEGDVAHLLTNFGKEAKTPLLPDNNVQGLPVKKQIATGKRERRTSSSREVRGQ